LTSRYAKRIEELAKRIEALEKRVEILEEYMRDVKGKREEEIEKYRIIREELTRIYNALNMIAEHIEKINIKILELFKEYLEIKKKKKWFL